MTKKSLQRLKETETEDPTKTKYKKGHLEGPHEGCSPEDCGHVDENEQQQYRQGQRYGYDMWDILSHLKAKY